MELSKAGGRRKLPIGIQDFAFLRNHGYLYVDKTEYIHALAESGKYYFLSRPRRFGKSLLLSAMRAYWEGKKELFPGLAAEQHIPKPHPVFYFDFNRDGYDRDSALEEVLEEHLLKWEAIYGAPGRKASLAARFQLLLEKAFVQNDGTGCVVLVDEYDKPLLESKSSSRPAAEEHNRGVFKGFFSTLKSHDHFLQFAFLTGVSKFSKISIFNDLNNLDDISFHKDYAALCGITEEEMEQAFLPEIKAMAKNQGMDLPHCLASLKEMYDGYRFHQNAKGVYNPFSLLNALSDQEFGSYWFETGTPSFLIQKLAESDFDIRAFTEGSIYADARSLSDYRADNPDPVPLLYQTGYLTIQGYDKVFRSFCLGYPNNEVKYGFLQCLAPIYLRQSKTDTPLSIVGFGQDIQSAKLDSLKNRLSALFASLPYAATPEDRPLERDFQNVIYIVFTLLGQFVRTEVHSARGRADAVVETENSIFLFEFKRDGSASEALAQIEAKGYALPYAADPRKLYRIGANFNSATRTLDGWESA